MDNSNGSRFLDLTAESAVVGVIATGLFDKIPGSKLVSPKVFTERRCQIPYSAALALRAQGIPVCTESVSDFIVRNRLDGELQRLLDRSNTVPWRENWPEFYDSSLAYCPSTGPVEYSLTVLEELHEKREALAVAKRMEAGDLSRKEAIEALQALGPEVKGELFVNLRNIIKSGLEPERASVAEILPESWALD